MTCILCAKRGKETPSETHVCVPCAARLQVDIADILRLAADAVAFVLPGASKGGGARSVPSSRPPLNVQAVDVENTPVPIAGQPPEVWPTVLQVLEAWERMCRESRGLARFGPASAARTAQGQTALSGVVNFLGQQVAWMTTEPEFPVDDFAGEVRDCLRVLRRWDLTAEERGTMVLCPTLTDDGECGRRLYYRDMDENVTCRRCGQTRDAATLALLAMEDGRDVWLDAEAAARHFSVDELVLRRWARNGRIRSSHGRYLVSSIADAIEQAKTTGYAHLARYMGR